MTQEKTSEKSEISEEEGREDEKIKRFELKDIIFLAIISAVITLANFITVPIVVSIPLVGIRQLVCAFPQGLLFTIGLLKVRKQGSILFLAFLTGIVLIPISWVIFAFNMFAAAITELIIFIIFRGFKKNVAILVGCSIYNPLTIPGAFLFQLWAAEPIAQYIENPLITILMFILSLGVALLGSLLGLKIGKSLKKAGKLS
jgi:energy-coupling factor transport system substrate-specific component